MELLAFVALWGRRSLVFMGVGLLILHYLIGIAMGLRFSSHEWLFLIFLVNVLYWIWCEYLEFRDKKALV